LEDQILLVEILKYLSDNMQTRYECITEHIKQLIGKSIKSFPEYSDFDLDNKLNTKVGYELAYLTSLRIITQDVNFERLQKTNVFVQDRARLHRMLIKLKIENSLYDQDIVI
jgi:hypothetical protein